MKTPTGERMPWSLRLLAGAGFLLALGVIVLLASRQLAMYEAQTYLQRRYKINAELPVEDVRAAFLSGPTQTGRALPPLGFCWTIYMGAGGAEAEVMINPWTHEVVDWHASL